ncbi:hypothetical protein CAEBREN_32744 [Caenorhabditis brenneri]|uniref:Kinesin motor domain-containing protein n=1 Tax=Caenorhabditis brenneri TaxID=135651 RepID=G0PEG4_CAEBE|nr:hypothetical protein CAEBREN_32744 [Caenorhabditis brenneri]
MKHREKVMRRQSVNASASCIYDSKMNEESQKMKELSDELKQTKAALRRAEVLIEKKDNEIAVQKEHIQKIMVFLKQEMLEKDNLIRKLNDENVDLRGQIRVGIRVRDYEKKDSDFQIMSQNEVKFRQANQSSFFTFENIFTPTIGQSDIFNNIQELILCVLHGKNVSLIAYGPTSSGKTYTMRGGDGVEKKGIIPRAIEYMLKQTGEDLAFGSWEYIFEASFLEVYNEELFDLLDDNRQKLDIRTTGSTSSVCSKKIEIKSLDDVDELLLLADSRRIVASTSCNIDSSRSHTVFQIFVNGSSEFGEARKCCLNLVDLAGSERAEESGAQGKQFTELKNINQSLTTLKRCIRAQMNKMPHVPYRDSKLTLLLREFLGAGSSKTMFIAHVNPTDISETKRTLDFTAELRSTNLGKAIVQTGQGKKT